MSDEAPFQIFISHRHNDAAIANVIYDMLKEWGVPEACMFSTSKVGKGDPGAPLTTALIRQIKQSDLFILVFTLADENWSYCMWELGVAMGLDTKPTKIVVFQCADSEPHVRTDCLMVNPNDETSLGNFVIKLLKAPEWVVPDESTREKASRALSRFQGRDEPFVVSAKDEMFAELQKVLPEGQEEELQRLEFISLGLSRGKTDEVRNLRQTAIEARNAAIEADGNIELGEERYKRFRRQAHDVLLDSLVVLDASNDEGLKRFGLQKYRDGVMLGDLFEYWEKDYQDNHGLTEDEQVHGWKRELLSDLSRATELRDSNVARFSMPSKTRGDERRFQPVIVRSRILPDGGMEFDLNFFFLNGL